ncbi:conserved hypothetical protein [Cupriavidus taiwanensis]|uniref:Uncharacterized protein n=1 Tax=Cupriavidus taiwanensis TaxID=164546 RepID=A0A375JA23_9BURK|nr:conserved hypothetical protein [Cupriavidus taiwanensis]
MHRLPYLLRDLQERLDQPRRRRVRVVQQRRDQARHRLSQGMGEPGQVAGRLEAQCRRHARAAPGRQAEDPGEPVRQPQPAGDRRVLRALHLRLRAPAEGAAVADPAHRASGLGADRPQDGKDRVGPELGRRPRRRVQLARPRQALRRRAEGDVLDLREHLHDVPAAPVRALPEPGLRGLVPVRLDLQARGRRHRAGRPGQVPRLAHVHLGLPVQEDLFQLAERQGREMPVLLSAHRGRPAHGLLRDLCRPHPLPRRDAVRRRPHRAGRVGGRRARPVPVATRRLPRSARPGSAGRGAAPGHPAKLARRRAQVAGLQDGVRMEGRLPAAPRVPHAADGLVHPAAVADPVGGRSGPHGHERHHPRRQEPAHPGQVPGQPADRGRRDAGAVGARPHAGDARLQALAGGRRRAGPGRAEASGPDARAGRGHVQDHGHRQLRGPLRDPVLAQGDGRGQLQRQGQLRLHLRQRLLGRHFGRRAVRQEAAGQRAFRRHAQVAQEGRDELNAHERTGEQHAPLSHPQRAARLSRAGPARRAARDRRRAG